jgi:hypothetical protein
VPVATEEFVFATTAADIVQFRTGNRLRIEQLTDVLPTSGNRSLNSLFGEMKGPDHPASNIGLRGKATVYIQDGDDPSPDDHEVVPEIVVPDMPIPPDEPFVAVANDLAGHTFEVIWTPSDGIFTVPPIIRVQLASWSFDVVQGRELRMKYELERYDMTTGQTLTKWTGEAANIVVPAPR